MKSRLVNLTCEVELQPGEKLELPETVTSCISSGRWIITIQPLAPIAAPFRNHQAFLNGYAPEDEGLYDDHPTG